jgi:putative spermidine/putrescine transport system substrate-binding protein
MSANLTRRTFSAFSIMAAAAVAVAMATPVAAQDSLSVGGIYGGVWADSIRASFLDPFAEQEGVTLRVEEGISAVTLAKLRQQRDDPQFDVVWMDRVVSDQAIREGLIEPISEDALDLSNVVEEAVIRNEAGEIVALTTGYWAAGIAYNRDDIDAPPSSWGDIGNDEFQGRIAVYSPENSINFPLLVTIAEIKGGGIENMDPAFELMARIGDGGAVFFGGSPAGANLLATGEVDIATLASSQVWSLQESGHPIEYLVPKEGAVAGDIRIHIVKGTGNKELAERLANYVISAEAQQSIAGMLFLGPVNTGAELAPEVDRKMPWGPGGSIDDLVLVDANAILDYRDEWTRRWNQEVAR